MGLDQFAYETNEDLNLNNNNRTEICYWRKHPNLQGWMEKLYVEKGGEKEFNCVYLELNEKDLDFLEEDVKNNNLPKTEGFFFGNDSSLYYKNQDLDFIKNSREKIKEGKRIFYYSWW